MRPMIAQRSAFCLKCTPAMPVYGTGVGLGVVRVPLAVAPGARPVPVPVAPTAPAELVLADGTPGTYDHEEEAEVIVAFCRYVSVSQ